MFENPNTSYDARVAQGVALLSEKDKQWFRRINVAKLDVKHGERCILAQLADGSWTDGARQYQVRDTSLQFNCGFYESPDMDGYTERYQKLTTAWRKAIIALCAGTYIGAMSAAEALAL